MSTVPQDPNEATYFKAEVEAILKRYPNMTAYQAIGALEVVKMNLMEDLRAMDDKDTEE